MNAAGQTFCLCMIVKNEAPVICRCLDSVRPIIDSWVIVDTGSTDGTQDMIREHLKDLPGELHERPWRDFAHNRSEALELARGRSDFTLIIDADDTLQIPPDARIPELTANSYTIEIDDSSTMYRRTQLVRSALPWRYEGVLHEYLTCDGSGPTEHLVEIRMRRNHDGARRKDPQTYRRDAAVLEAALQTETRPFLLSRYRFYLAQSYRDCGEREKALENYLQRAELGFWQEEVFVSLYEAAKLKEQLGHPDHDVIDAYLRASDALPSRAEALHGACRFCRYKGRNEEGYRIGKRGLDIPLRSDALFVQPWIYEFGLRDEFAVNAYWAGHYRESLDACLHLLGSSTLSDGFRDRVTANARFALQKLPQQPPPDAIDVMIWPTGTRCPGIMLVAPRSVPGMVSVITPTRNRAGFLNKALTYFRGQDYQNIEWLILDDGTQNAESLGGLADENISYERVNGKISIGEKRNRLIEKSRGEFIIQFDDDDYYAPNYVSTMVSALNQRDADLINLRGWFMYDLRSDFFGYWDLMQKEGPHYRCDQGGVALTMLNPENNRSFANNHLGYGFSYAFRRTVWEAVKFPDIDWNEDGEFSQKARSDFKLDGIHDTTGLCLHFLHPASTSRCFPQHHLPAFLLTRLFGPAVTSSMVKTGATRKTSGTATALARPVASRSGWVPARSQGGTELMSNGLRQRMGKALDPINLFINSYEDSKLDGRPLVVWVHHDIDQAAIQWLRNKERISRIVRLVFVSEWQKARFVAEFGLPPEKCVVLKNAIEVSAETRRWTPDKPLRMAYTSIPYRGLSVLLDAWGQLRPADAELHIWSSVKLYGQIFDDSPYQNLYDQAASLPGVTYHGIVPNAELRAALRDIHFLTYPSTFQETSCLSVIDAMASGCRVICPAYGALPQTAGKFARLYPFLSDSAEHAKLFAQILAEEIRNPWGGNFALAEEQQHYARSTYDWSVRIPEWQAFIDMLKEPA